MVQPEGFTPSGLYKLTLRAQRSNPNAAKFQDWVTKEVLPAILQRLRRLARVEIPLSRGT